MTKGFALNPADPPTLSNFPYTSLLDMSSPSAPVASSPYRIRFKTLPALKRGEMWRYFGPAFVASVAYIDPGNFAANIEGGTHFGYTLLWVLLWSNLMAMLVQYLSAKLG